MTALAWPAVALVAFLVLVWRADAFARRWGVTSALAKRVALLEAEVAKRAPLDGLSEVREKVDRLTLRVGVPR